MNETPVLIDLSVTFGPNPSDRVPVSIERMSHRAGGAHLAQLVGMEQEQLEGGRAWASERIHAITHSGTHMDAPFHYSPVVAGRPARTIDELPLDWFWRPGCCIRVDEEPLEQLIDAVEVLTWEARVGHRIGPGEIVLFHTGASAAYGRSNYSDQGRGMAPALVHLLAERGVRVFGTDAWSIDPPYHLMRQRLESHGASSVWAAHLVGRNVEFCVLEKLCNLDALPPTGFWVACFPIKIHRGSGAWVRPVAILPGEEI